MESMKTTNLLLAEMQQINGSKRNTFYPNLSPKFMHLENLFYTYCEKLSSDYATASPCFTFYGNDNGLRLPVVDGTQMFRCTWADNYSEGEMTATYFSLAAWVFTLNQHIRDTQSESLYDVWEGLMDLLYSVKHKIHDLLEKATGDLKEALENESAQISLVMGFLD